MRTIEYFERGATIFPNNLAFVDEAESVSYADADRRVHQAACGLIDLGYNKGAKVGVLSPNSVVAYIALLAIFRAEFTWLPINPRNTIETNQNLLENFDCELLIYHSYYAKEAELLKQMTPSIREIVCLDARIGDGLSFADFSAITRTHIPRIRPEPSDVAVIFPSGGTTGPSKGIQATNLMFATFFAGMYASFDYSEGSRHLVVAPMTHTSGLFGCLHFAAGGTNYIMPQFDAKAVLNAIERWKISHIFLPPTALYMMLADPSVSGRDYSSLRHFFIAAAPSALEKIKEAHRVFGPVMSEVFGQAECTPPITAKAPKDYINADGSLNEKRMRSAGRPSPVCHVAIMDDDGNFLPPGQAGEIVVRSNLTTPGYYKNPERTKGNSRFGWHHTEDIGVMDEDGFVTIIDRKRDMIISGGFNVFPNDVEQAICQHPAVVDCAVIGLRDEKWGELVTAVVQLKPEAAIDERELIGFTKERVGSVQAPKKIFFTADLPRSPAGKVLKRVLREQYDG